MAVTSEFYIDNPIVTYIPVCHSEEHPTHKLTAMSSKGEEYFGLLEITLNSKGGVPDMAWVSAMDIGLGDLEFRKIQLWLSKG
ncbi:hypothetical protein DAPPUDRAFT_252444 [Daphnia pulex]|uniref:Uncharacterized protein n=1 Tax=Daphnia pulex TaxID=6669 RepID=E9H2P8_DAPPU|nr:hypothetical protein DAPPUDRAFT_252444 [Daphnia pulex]|eukprot:EFX74009.1 hypothetical protein DAPPUDRAFT_252444 [Daphnia pulex]